MPEDVLVFLKGLKIHFQTIFPSVLALFSLSLSLSLSLSMHSKVEKLALNTQVVFTYSKSTKETLEQLMKYAQSIYC